MAKRKPCKPKPKEDWERLLERLETSYFANTLANPAQVLTPVHIK